MAQPFFLLFLLFGMRYAIKWRYTETGADNTGWQEWRWRGMGKSVCVWRLNEWIENIIYIYFLLMMAFFHLQLRYLYLSATVALLVSLFKCRLCIVYTYGSYYMFVDNKHENFFTLSLLLAYIIFWIAFTIKLQFCLIFHRIAQFNVHIILLDSMNISCSNHLWVLSVHVHVYTRTMCVY